MLNEVISKKLHILQHSLGVDNHGQGDQYRNHFVTGADSDDWPACRELVAEGLMTETPGNAITGGGSVFRVTPAGVDYVALHSPAPPKLTRSQRRYEAFLDADSGMRFGEWLKLRGAS